jgi:hypothetical protein
MIMITTDGANKHTTAKMMDILNPTIAKNIELGRRTLEEVRADIACQKGNAETRDGILSRLNLLLQDPDFKQIICGDGFEIGELIDKQESLIVDTSGLSLMKQVFMGTLIANLVKSYFLYARPKEYKPLIMTIDECHLFVSTGWTIIPKMARKYRISTILSTTDTSMMPKSLIHTLLSNSATIVALNTGFVEAQMLANEFTSISKEDIQGIKKYHAYVKTQEGEYLVKLPRPLYVKEVPIKVIKQETRDFGLKWFDLPSYCFQLDYEPDGVVAGDGHKDAQETPPASTEGG